MLFVVVDELSVVVLSVLLLFEELDVVFVVLLLLVPLLLLLLSEFPPQPLSKTPTSAMTDKLVTNLVRLLILQFLPRL